MVPEGSWTDAPKDAFILGIKELTESFTPIPQTHIYFAHAYNVSMYITYRTSNYKNGSVFGHITGVTTE